MRNVVLYKVQPPEYGLTTEVSTDFRLQSPLCSPYSAVSVLGGVRNAQLMACHVEAVERLPVDKTAEKVYVRCRQNVRGVTKSACLQNGHTPLRWGGACGIIHNLRVPT